MFRKVVDLVPNALLGQAALGVGAFGLIMVVGYSLAYGSDGLMALGFSRQTAGIATVVVVLAACLYGLYWFATRMIDW
ncbi:hypothetical protein [Halobacterium wangiae]|uniref:hypothetical protein n=1 Tax=Halobacterium wangiae TaxID=2902623 RepID=UPI001E581793|nr:hypothetical protein [Halobacterium wangiae]